MIRYILLTIGLVLLGSTCGVDAQHKRKIERASTITATSATVECDKGLVRVGFTLILPERAARRNFKYTLTPIFMSQDSSVSLRLTPITPVGLRKGRANHRNAVLGRRAKSYNRLITTESEINNGTRYSISVPYQGWFSSPGLSLVLEKQMHSYHKPIEVQMMPLLDNVVVPTPWKSLVDPLVIGPKWCATPSWMRESIEYNELLKNNNLLLPQTGDLAIRFATGSKRMRPHYKGNKATLHSITPAIKQLDSNLTVERLSILGQAISDGDNLLQGNLITRRGEVSKRYLARKTVVDSSLVDVVLPRSVWFSLRNEIANSAMERSTKKYVLKMIDTTTCVAALERNLMLLDDGLPYWYIKDHLLPGLTDAAYLSLCYGDQLRPTDQYIRHSMALMNRGQYADAIPVLSGAAADPRASNLLGTSRLLTNADALSELNGRLNFEPNGHQYIVRIDKVTERDNCFAPPASPYIAPYGEYVADSSRKSFVSDSTTLAVLFQVAQSKLSRDFKNNDVTLDTLLSIISQMQNNKKMTIKKIRIVGQASPEGRVNLNERLSMERAEALRSYLCANSSISSDVFDIVSVGPASDELRAMVAASDMEGRDEVLEVLDRTKPGFEREESLEKLKYGYPYLYMKDNMYPHLRNATYFKLYYQWEPYTNYHVINRAIDMIRGGEYAGARDLLMTVRDDPNAALPLGVALMMDGKTDLATPYLESAAQIGRAIKGQTTQNK